MAVVSKTQPLSNIELIELGISQLANSITAYLGAVRTYLSIEDSL